MPVDPAKKTPTPVQDIPPDETRSVAQLGDLINDRIRQVNAALTKYVANPAQGDVDLAQFQIHNLADPKDDLDAVNLRTLKRGGSQAIDQQVTATGSGIEQPTIYFEFDSAPFDGEESPFAIIMDNRAGFTPTAVSLSAVGSPTSASCQINLTIDEVDMLADNLGLPVGEQGAVFTSSFAKPGSLTKGTKIKAVVIVAGGATQITIGLSLRGNK